MKRFLLLFVCFFFGGILFAQDIITKNDGTDIQAKVVEVGQSSIRYKKFSNLDGPTYTISLSDILMITYENGEREVYNAKNETKKQSSLPQGLMTYNSWSGKVSVGGVTIERESLGKFFTREDLALYDRGKSIGTFGGVISIVGALPFGYEIGKMVGGDDPNLYWLIGGCTAALIGIALNAAGGGLVKQAISHFNSSVTFQPEFRFGATPNAIGLAFVF